MTFTKITLNVFVWKMMDICISDCFRVSKSLENVDIWLEYSFKHLSSTRNLFTVYNLTKVIALICSTNFTIWGIFYVCSTTECWTLTARSLNNRLTLSMGNNNDDCLSKHHLQCSIIRCNPTSKQYSHLNWMKINKSGQKSTGTLSRVEAESLWKQMKCVRSRVLPPKRREQWGQTTSLLTSLAAV